MNRSAPAILAAALALTASGAARADSFAFDIYKESDKIGQDAYTVTKEGETTKVEVNTKTDVKLLFLEFHFLHHRTEVWNGGALQSFLSDTNDDGTKHHIEVRMDGGKLDAVADGAKKTMPADAIPFTLWGADIFKHPLMFDVTDFQTLKVGIEDKGSDKLSRGGAEVQAHHLKMTGDENWDLWLAPDGTLLKTAFKRRGYPIFFIRQ